MPRFIREFPLSRVYSSAMESWIPWLEEQLFRRLQRLENKIARHELQRGQTESRRDRAAMRKPQRPVDAQPSIGRPSVVVLGARLRSDQRYCRTLIERVATVIYR